MRNQYLTDTYQYLTNASMIPYLTDPLLKAKLILTDFLIQINIYHYLSYFSIFSSYLNDSYRLGVLKTGLAWTGRNGIEIHNPHWILLKSWAQTRKLQDKQNSKIDSLNES